MKRHLRQFQRMAAPLPSQHIRRLRRIMRVFTRAFKHKYHRVITRHIQFRRIHILHVRARRRTRNRRHRHVVFEQVIQVFRTFHRKVVRSNSPSTNFSKRFLLLSSTKIFVHRRATSLISIHQRINGHRLQLQHANRQINFRVVRTRRSRVTNSRRKQTFQ